MNRFIQSTLVLCAFPCTLLAQEMTTTAGQEFMDNLTSQNYFQTEMVFDDSFKGTQGSPYFNNDWQSGTFVLDDGRNIKGEMLYDMVEDQLIIKRGKRTGFKLVKRQIRSFNINQLQFVNNGESLGFLQVMSEGPVTLYAKRGKRIREADKESVYSTNQDYHQYLDQNRYYLELQDGSLIKCPASVGGVIKLFPNHKLAIKKFARSEQLFLREERDLRKLIQHCQHLISNNP